ncbi:ABC transporter permease [Pseudorhodoplanes sinuspersici]|uniref:ABC transporter permease n=1 Tax=Pseudorhodoplanes sinuspersici TaxID=1235591 RepID=A0A1W6ZZ27_9HYPH|nr:ABC transporter permease [Pseudorhodoplanes sinuspersici]ARQ02642.1 ABC transporter permease [Pseudorhodoplanes sinuspersici]RKE74514.1 NitT/TauT family transport system permease protein [Pseudorhodoplanes sinuspersici]
MNIAAVASRAVTPLVYIVALVVWEILARSLKIPLWMLPAPTMIAAAAIEWAPELLSNSIVTTRETVLGFLLALVISLPLACAIAFSTWARKIIYPAILGLQSIPKVALAPLVTLWLGFTEWPKIVIVVLVCFFPILVNVVAGFESVPKSMVDLMRSLNAPQHLVLWRLRVPAALPAFFTGCKIAITFAVIGAVIAEFVAAQEGLGYLILMSTSQSQTPLAFAAIIALTAISILLFYILEFIEKKTITWTP